MPGAGYGAATRDAKHLDRQDDRVSVQTGSTSSWADFAAGVHAYRGFLVVEPYQLTVSADARSSVEAARDLALAPDAQAQVAHMLVYLAFNTMEGARSICWLSQRC